MTEHPTLRLLVATDGSPAAMAATRSAVALASSCGAALKVVTVVTEDDGAAPLARGRADMERSLVHASRLAREAGVPATADVLDGHARDAYEAILAASVAWDADFIFVGRTGRHGPGRAMMGSQAEHLLEFSDIPVVVVPPSGGRRP